MSINSGTRAIRNPQAIKKQILDFQKRQMEYSEMLANLQLQLAKAKDENTLESQDPGYYCLKSQRLERRIQCCKEELCKLESPATEQEFCAGNLPLGTNKAHKMVVLLKQAELCDLESQKADSDLCQKILECRCLESSAETAQHNLICWLEHNGLTPDNISECMPYEVAQPILKSLGWC